MPYYYFFSRPKAWSVAEPKHNSSPLLCQIFTSTWKTSRVMEWNGNVKDSTALPTEARLLTGCSCLQIIWFLHSLPGLTSSSSVLFVVFTGTGSIAKPQALVAVPTSYGRSWFPSCPDQQRTTEHHLSTSASCTHAWDTWRQVYYWKLYSRTWLQTPLMFITALQIAF